MGLNRSILKRSGGRKRRQASIRCGIAALALSALAAMSLNGCESQPKAQSPASNSSPMMTTPVQPLNRPAGMMQSVQVVAGLLPLGTIPYDNMVLPLVSPDGRFLAVQTGAPPTWPTALAEPGAEVPVATQLEVYELDLRQSISAEERMPPTLITSVSEPAILGRSCDSEGFLIEAIREDGSRWIGKANWRGGDIQWLVTGSDVNAFAAMGLDGRLAWSRRTVDSDTFELVVRTARGEEWSVGSLDENFLMPTWSNRGDRLYFLSLSIDGRLDACHGNANSAAALRQSIERLPLANDATIYTAYQTVIGQAGAVDGSLPGRDQFVFFHPGLDRIAVWRPLATSNRQRIHLNAKSIAALVDEEDFAFVTTPTHLLRQNLRVAAEQIQLVGGVQVPRQITSATWPYLLLNPGEGRIGITAMRLLPRDQALFKTR